MRRILCAAGIALITCACSESKEGSEVEKLEKYTEAPPPQQSRAQIRFYAESEGKLRPIEKEIQTVHERMKAGYKPSSAREATLLILETAALTARAKVNELKKVGAADWEPLKGGIDESLNQVIKYHADFTAAAE